MDLESEIVKERAAKGMNWLKNSDCVSVLKKEGFSE